MRWNNPVRVMLFLADRNGPSLGDFLRGGETPGIRKLEARRAQAAVRYYAYLTHVFMERVYHYAIVGSLAMLVPGLAYFAGSRFAQVAATVAFVLVCQPFGISAAGAYACDRTARTIKARRQIQVSDHRSDPAFLIGWGWAGSIAALVFALLCAGVLYAAIGSLR